MIVQQSVQRAFTTEANKTFGGSAQLNAGRKAKQEMRSIDTIFNKSERALRRVAIREHGAEAREAASVYRMYRVWRTCTEECSV